MRRRLERCAFAGSAPIARARLQSAPTPIEELPNLARATGPARLYVKRDDLSALAFGGNKVRQLEFYLGEALQEGADTVLITGAVQSNFVRLAAAAARKLGLEPHVQLEERVPRSDPQYRNSGNVLLDRLFGATIHRYGDGEDEQGADRAVRDVADALRAEGRRPYVIPLAPGHKPLGALGYVLAAQEILDQAGELGAPFDEIVVASGSGNTHAGLLFGLRALGARARVTGICVRRAADLQGPRILARCAEIAELLQMPCPVGEADIAVDDRYLAPGYGRMGAPVLEALRLAARHEALILDPVYTAKTMAGFLDAARRAADGERLLMVHTGGTPALFAYEAELTAALTGDEPSI